jgi:hypothetical protein
MPIYIHTNQQTSGPFEENGVRAWLQAGQISPEVLACPQGASEWLPLRTLLPGPAHPQSSAARSRRPLRQCLTHNQLPDGRV